MRLIKISGITIAVVGITYLIGTYLIPSLPSGGDIVCRGANYTSNGIGIPEDCTYQPMDDYKYLVEKVLAVFAGSITLVVLLIKNKRKAL